MIVIACAGGLGNQMFQYAYYLNQKIKFNEEYVKFDISWFNKNKVHNGYELEKIFKLKIDYANKTDIRAAGKPINIIDKITNKILAKPKPWYSSGPVNAITYLSDIVEIKEGYFYGFWQSPKYFESIADKIRKDFHFKNPLDEKNEILRKDIINSDSVSVHIRRGDYLNNKTVENICTNNYYINSIMYIKKLIKKPKFFIFSNDIEWCKINLQIENAVYIDWNTGINSYKDMQLMSYCKHNIIANSTFSWWSAWLNDYHQKIVCVPQRWFNISGHETQDIYPDEWIRISI